MHECILPTIHAIVNKSVILDSLYAPIYNRSMVHPYQGNYPYNQKVVGDWNNSQIGVYYCGHVLPNGNLSPLYIGQGVGQDGIKGRLLQHLNRDSWSDVTHFGYSVCDTAKEAENLETAEIAKYKPKYNTQGKNLGY